MTDQLYRRRESHRADQQAARAAQRGDRAAYLMALAKADAARQRRADRERGQAEAQGISR